MTNRCPCSCTFCVRNGTRALGDADDLWLDHEPSVEEVMDAIRIEVPTDAKEIVFCGYGEPTERFDDLIEIARRIKEKYPYSVRLDTNGLGNLINGRNIVPEMVGLIDKISISLNAPNEERYLALTNSRFGEGSYGAVIDFIKESRRRLPDVTVSVVGFSLADEEIPLCKDIATDLGVKFRVR